MSNQNGESRSKGRPESEGRREEREEFDAVSAVQELEESLRGGSSSERGGDEDGGGEGYVQMLEGELSALQNELAEARARADKAEARTQESAGEVERAKERIERESERLKEQELRKALVKFLDVLDDLERAIASAREMDHNPEVVKGVDLVKKRFLSVLGEFGVRPVPAQGERFDPEWHEAMSTLPASDASQDGVVMHVLTEGYAIGDEVLRPARVVVGKAG